MNTLLSLLLIDLYLEVRFLYLPFIVWHQEKVSNICSTRAI